LTACGAEPAASAGGAAAADSLMGLDGMARAAMTSAESLGGSYCRAGADFAGPGASTFAPPAPCALLRARPRLGPCGAAPEALGPCCSAPDSLGSPGSPGSPGPCCAAGALGDLRASALGESPPFCFSERDLKRSR
jgi:hypothetical protein